jgi:hypothetical protein
MMAQISEVPMADLPELQRYSMETTEQMLAHEGKYDNSSIIMLICEAIDLKSFREGEESISLEERIVDAVWSLDTEVMNGGYSQFFCNTSGMHTPIIVDALKRAFCPRAAEITEHAIASLQLPEMTVEAARAGVEKEDPQIEASLEKCGDDFVEARDGEDLPSNLLRFIRENMNSIRLV